ncbi:MAG TPA: peptide-methionine (S)-S-oxide reductase MsrA [Holophagaceae bacterium]|nr:peptide-methionine (S)-S-oxide reductase MsrA [Holophagaceae bacterium]
MVPEKKKLVLPTIREALTGRNEVMHLQDPHRVLGLDLEAEPKGCEVAYFAAGCFWGVERLFWRLPGVVNTAVGYQAGHTPNPTYEEVCSGETGHAEVVKVVYDPRKISFDTLLSTFWEAHDPTQGMRQGNDEGTQYRSGIYPTTETQRLAAEASRTAYDIRLRAAGFAPITTEILPAPPFYFAEPYHQQYLDRNPEGYCGLKGTGVSCRS